MPTLARTQTADEAPPTRPVRARRPKKTGAAAPLLTLILATLDDAKAEDVLSIDLDGRSSIADQMVIATGRVDRHVAAIADRVVTALKDAGHPAPRVEGAQANEWVLIDAGDVIVHVFRPEARAFYNIEKLWGADRPKDARLDH